MKKLSFIILITLIVLVSCTKEQQNESFKSITLNSQLNNTGKNEFYNSITIEGVTKFKDMLWFKDMNSYLSALENLYKFQDLDIQNFNKLYINNTMINFSLATENELDSLSNYLELKETEIGFSEHGIYAQFENSLNFKSLREKIESLNAIFLNNENPDWDKFPGNHKMFLPEERTTHNQFGEVKIGNSIYVVTNDFLLEITDGNYETALALRGNQTNFSSFKNVRIVDEDNFSGKIESDCAWWKNIDGFYVNPNNNNRRVKWYIGVSTSIAKRIAAETINFKKDGNKWSKYKTWCSARATGVDCFNLNVNPLGFSSTENFSKSVTDRRDTSIKMKNGNVFGLHQGANGITYSSTLWW